MFDVQYNLNTFEPHLRRAWAHAQRVDTLEAGENYIKESRDRFEATFNRPCELQYRIVTVKTPAYI
jgi:hypothetical protein